MPRRKSSPGPGPQSSITRAANAVQKAVAQRSLWFYLTVGCGLVLDEEYDGPVVEAIERGDWTEVIDLAARGSGKTHFWAGVMSWWIRKDPNWRGLVTGVNMVKATGVVFLTRQFVEAEKVVEWFGPADTDYWSSERFIVRGRYGRPIMEPTLYAMGIDAFRPGGHHDFILFEDVDDQERTQSQEVIEQTRRTDGLAYPMADLPGARRAMTATFYSADDLAHYKLESLSLYDYVDSLPVIPRGVTKKGKSLLIYRPGADSYDEGFCPRKRYTREQFEERKAKMTPYEYALQVKLDILGNEDAPFQKKDFVYDDENSGPVSYEVFIGVDAARSRKKGSDFCGFAVVHVGPDGKWFVASAKRQRMDGSEFIDHLMNLFYQYPDAVFSIEEDAYVAGLRIQMEERFRRERKYPRINYVSAPSRPRKDPRILALQGLFRSKAIVFCRGKSEAVEEELLPFPGPGRRDVSDALANVLEVVKTPTFRAKNSGQFDRLSRETMWIRRLFDMPEKNRLNNPQGPRKDWREA